MPHVVMVKKRLASGEPCRKCAQTEDMLRKRGLWERIDEVVWAAEGDPDSPGMKLAALHGVETAPFFVVKADDGAETIYRSALKLIKKELSGAAAPARADADPDEDLAAIAASYLAREPIDLIRWGLERYGAECVIAFSGSDDVVLVDMAARTGLPFSVCTVDTGRLHPETLEFVEKVRTHYGIDIGVTAPDAAELQPFVRKKGLFSFYEDGHSECCSIRKVKPLARMLRGYKAWITGQRRDQSLETRAELPVIEEDPAFEGKSGMLVKLNPLAAWTAHDLWNYVRENEVPHNPLHLAGFRSIGCAPCTRPVLPSQHEREGRWWWEQADKKECGLHAGNLEEGAKES